MLYERIRSMSDGCCETGIDPARLHRRQRRVLTIVLLINVATFLMMVAASLLSGSSSLLSGTLDNFGDAVTYALSFAVVGASGRLKARVALFKGAMILTGAFAVAAQIVWRLLHPATPIVETMGVAAFLNLGANLVCLRLLTPHRSTDINMASVWECSRNDVVEGLAVIVTAGAVWFTSSAWPDLIVAIVLLIVFLRSALRVLGASWQELRSFRAA
jgi:Co/Zn/Cd efflux system component